MTIVYNHEDKTRKTLMIHSFQSNFEGIPGDNDSKLHLEMIMDENGLKKEFMEYINQFEYITFDDGLYVQTKLIKLFPKEKVIFFPSFGLMRPEEIQPKPIENSIAHKNKKTSLSTFMTSTEAWDLMQSGYKLGMHGWYHLNLNLNHLDIDIEPKTRLKLIRDDAKKCAETYLSYMEDLIKGGSSGYTELYFCTPYNCLNDLQRIYIEFLAHYLETLTAINIPKKLIIFSYERIPIENFIKE